MDEMTMLRELGRKLDREPPGTLARQRNRITTTRAVRGHRRWRPVLAGGVVLASVAGAIVTQSFGIGDRRPGAVAEAAVVLDRAAAVADGLPRPSPGQYLYIDGRSWTLTYVDGKGWKGLRAEDSADWLPVDGGKPGLFRLRQSGTGPFPPNDGAPVPGQDGWTQEWVCDRAMGQEESKVWDLTRPPANCSMEAAYRRDLPTDASGMLRHLHKDGDGSKEDRAWENARDLLGGAIPPPSRAALFRALRRIPDVTYVPDTTDATGRHGVAVARVVDRHIREELVFDRTTYAYLGSRSVLVRSFGGRPAGTVSGATAVRTAYVDQIGRLP
ncbi:CU044_5270 family protein [Actinoallomurus sp. NPDC050550]|uniref:CU044_5270 family protein n=1 Tax=Actinoallomurus sp. NPDC050550 TaxID=3154937 RepID=UPI0033DBBD1F